MDDSTHTYDKKTDPEDQHVVASALLDQERKEPTPCNLNMARSLARLCCQVPTLNLAPLSFYTTQCAVIDLLLLLASNGSKINPARCWFCLGDERR